MGSDAPPDRYKALACGLTVNIGIDEAWRMPNAFFCAGGQRDRRTCPSSRLFWATRFGMLTDKFGIPWMINCPQTGGNE